MSRQDVSAMVRVFIEMRMRAHPSPKPDAADHRGTETTVNTESKES